MPETYRPRPGDRAWNPLARTPWLPPWVRREAFALAVCYRDGVVFTVDRATGEVLHTTTEEAVFNDLATRGHPAPHGAEHLPAAVGAWGWTELRPEALGALQGLQETGAVERGAQPPAWPAAA